MVGDLFGRGFGFRVFFSFGGDGLGGVLMFFNVLFSYT